MTDILWIAFLHWVREPYILLSQLIINDASRKLFLATTGEDIIYCGDDSAGELGDIVRQCFEKWYELSIDDSLPPTMRSKIFELSLTHFAEGCLKGFDWWWDWVQIAILLADTPDKQERVMNELNSIIDITAPIS